MTAATRRIGTVLWLAAASLAAMPRAADARGFVSFHFGVPLVGPPVYYYPPPPVVYYYPAPAYAPPVAAGPSQPQQTCHEYRTTAIIDGKPQTLVGTACLQPDGTWRMGP